MNRRRFQGFTLVELLVAMCLVVLVTGATAAVLSAGFRVWERVQSQWEMGSETEGIFLSVGRAVHNMHPFKKIPFEGEYDAFSFPMLVRMKVHGGPEYDEIGRVGFFFNSSTGSLCRSNHSYRGLSGSSVRAPDEIIITGVQRLRFSYLTLDAVSGAYTWSDSWKDVKPPRAVKVDVTYQLKATGETVNRSDVIEIPCA